MSEQSEQLEADVQVGDDKRKMSFEYCPACAGELDTGFECKKCGRDWRPWAIFESDSIRDEGYGWCVWRLTDGIGEQTAAMSLRWMMGVQRKTTCRTVVSVAA